MPTGEYPYKQTKNGRHCCAYHFLYFTLQEYEQDEAYNVGYDKGYEDGIKYALSQLREGAVDWKIYMDIEDVDDSVHAYLEDYPDIDCCDVRDMIIYNPDFEHYSLEELLETLIKENIDE